MKNLLVIVDMQNDFVTGCLGGAAAQAIVPRIAELLENRADDTDVVFTRDTHTDDYLATREGRKLPVKHCVKGTYGWQIVDQLAPYAQTVIDKPVFGSAELARFVALHKYEEVTFAGVCTDICVVSNALLVASCCPLTEVKVAASACAGSNKVGHESAIKVLRSCLVTVI